MKKIIATILSISLLLLSTTSVLAASNSPRLVVKTVNHEELIAGGDYQLYVTVENIGNYRADDAAISLATGNDSPISVTNPNPTIYTDQIEVSDTETYLFYISIDALAETGTYPLTLSGSYSDYAGKLYELSEQINLSISDNRSEDNIDVQLQSETSLESGETSNITISLNNTDSKELRFVDINFTSLTSDTLMTTGSGQFYFDTIASNTSQEISIDLSPSDQLKAGIYPVTLEISYTDFDGIKRVEIESFNVTVIEVEDETVESQIIIKEVISSKSSIVADETFVITATIENVGEEAESFVKLEISQDAYIISETQSAFVIESIEPGETIEKSFTLKATDSAKTQNYPVEITAYYGDNDSVNQYSGIYVYNDEEEEEEDDIISTPRMIIDQFTTGSDKLFVGDEFVLDFTIRNTSKTQDIQNLKVMVSAASANNTSTAFLPINQSGSVYVGDLLTEATYGIGMPFKIVASAAGQIYTLTVSFEYEDSEGNRYTDSESINIPVYEEPMLEVSDVRIGTQLDNAYTLELDFYNTGKVDISNLMVDIEGDFITSNSNYYVGDFGTGRMDVYDVEITGAYSGSATGTITFTYDDTFGESTTIVKDFSLGSGGTNNNPSGDAASGDNPGGFGAGTGTGRTGDRTAMAGGMDMSEEDRAALQNMTQEERMAFLENGGTNMAAVDDTATSLPILPIGIGTVAIIGLIIIVVIIKKRKKATA